MMYSIKYPASGHTIKATYNHDKKQAELTAYDRNGFYLGALSRTLSISFDHFMDLIHTDKKRGATVFQYA